MPGNDFSGNGADRLDLDVYVPFFITAIANKWTASASRVYLAEFAIGVAEWRILASLGARGTATSLEVVTLVGMDAGAVSRAMRMLEAKHLVRPLDGRFPGRSKPYAMTADGEALFGKVRARAVAREAVLLQDMDDADRQSLLRLLKLMHGRLTDLAGPVPEQG